MGALPGMGERPQRPLPQASPQLGTQLPPPVIAQHEGFLVVRDDLLYGGTKRRALEACLEEGWEYVFATPAEGHAQLALALAAKSRGALATLFVAKRSSLAPRTALAKEQGAKIREVPLGRLSNVQAKARAYAAPPRGGCTLLELGLRSEQTEDALTVVCSEVNAEVCRMGYLGGGERGAPKRVWFAIGSGTLARCIHRAFPWSEANGVVVGHAPKREALPAVGDRFMDWQASERFDQDALVPPPFPSSPNYDAKVWRFAQQFGEPGDLIWNVA